MSNEWSGDQPIYKQLRDRVAASILNGAVAEGDFVPSVRQVSAEQQINHITVAKAYQELVDQGVLEMKRGRGMMVADGARERLMADERTKFETQEIPKLHARLASLGIDHAELKQALDELNKTKGGK